MRANGGGGTEGGGGSGGRIFLGYGANTFSGTVTVNAGVGSSPQNGTLVKYDTTTQTLIVDSSQIWSASPTREGPVINYTNISIRNNATLTVQGHFTTDNDGYGMTFTAQNFTLESGSTLTSNGAGYSGGASFANGRGPGGGRGQTNMYGSGAGHATAGGISSSSLAGGSSYGNEKMPIALGSGGGGGTNAGGSGGGAVIVNATSTITINGTISVNGNAGNGTTYHSGGGSGGSVYLYACILAGNGTITANGGNGGSTSGGRGAAGRIALSYTCANNFTGTIQALPGSSGAAPSLGSGTIRINTPRLIVKGGTKFQGGSGSQ
jgi:hypothetical protein